jgi:TolB-like protein/AraC-like DNA-binding protein
MTNELSMDKAFIKKLNDILETNFENEQFGVKELSDHLGLSRSQLHRKLNSINDKSASQFIREYRLEKAMDMLQNNVATDSEIAYRVGFNSPSYFNTSFNQYFGYPPGEVKYRANTNHDDEEDIQLSPDDKQTITIKRKLFKQRTYLIVALAILVLATFSYYNYSKSSSNTGQPTENKQIIELEENSIAVLPFKNWSGDPDLEYISDGMTDAVISKLSGIKAINKIIPFTSITKYKGTDKDINTIANELEVKYILEGNFKLSGTQVQSNLKLIEASNNKHLWSLEYTGVWNSDEIFELQALIAENVAKEMNAEITDSEFTAIEKMPTKNIEAYDSYLHASYNTNQYNKTAFKNAIPLYERAIQLDPNFTDAYIGFGRHWS